MVDNNAEIIDKGKVIRYILIGKNETFTINDIFEECKKININEPALVYRILDDLCKKDIIIPKTNGYQPAYFSDAV